jgi:hypothetical protein
MQDGSYRALTNSEFAKGIETMRKQPFAATRCPVSRLQGWLRDKSADPGIFKAELAQCEQQFQETQQGSGTNASTDKTMMTSEREQLVIEVLSESDDDRTGTQQVHVKSEVQVKDESSAMAAMQRKLDKMEKLMAALVPRPRQHRTKAPQKTAMPSDAPLQLQIGSSEDELSDSYSCDISQAAKRKLKGPETQRVEKKRNNDLRAWTLAKERNRHPYRIWDDIHEATATNGHDAFQKVQKLGYAVIMDYKNLTDSAEGAPYSLFAPENEPTQEQANFHKTGQPSAKGPPPMETIFEGVKINQSSYRFDPVKPTQARVGTELRASLKYGSAAYKAYQKLYKGQADDIIQKIFKNHTQKNGSNPAADPRNWGCEHNFVVGGVEYQHPHADLAKPGSFTNDHVFPFVAVHGFGVNEFQMWLLPCKHKREHGFLFNFPKTAILFMRGDFIHAGGCAQDARAHIEMYPQRAAGWDEENPYWETEKMEHWQKNKITFLIPDLRCRPFGYPHMSKKNTAGDQIVTYPPKLTSDLILPIQRPKKKRKRPDNEADVKEEHSANRKKKGKKRKRPDIEADEKEEHSTNSDTSYDAEYKAAVLKQKQLSKVLRKQRS